MSDDNYEVVGFLPASGTDASGFLRVPQVEGAVGDEIYRGRSYELPDWLPKPASGEPRRVPAAELVEAIRERIGDACTCDEALKEALLAAVDLHDPYDDERESTDGGVEWGRTCPTCFGGDALGSGPCAELKAIGAKLGIEIGDE